MWRSICLPSPPHAPDTTLEQYILQAVEKLQHLEVDSGAMWERTFPMKQDCSPSGWIYHSPKVIGMAAGDVLREDIRRETPLMIW